LKNSNLSNMNTVIFIGDSKDNFIFKFDFVDNEYTIVPYDSNNNYLKQNNKDSDYALNFSNF